ncbi:MAG: family 43 glycosylhydrolase [Muribaculaceae bacterium]|nr:family 43 glycosylhydrolase [Muribaculaceae bacterium]
MKIKNCCIVILLGIAALVLSPDLESAPRFVPKVRRDVPVDSIILSDPAVLADSASRQYYMTGTGGMIWKSKDLKLWSGPYRVTEIDTTSWMGSRPAIWAAELHQHDGRYYYFATFTNENIIIEENVEGKIPRRASHILVSDKPDGPYRPVGTEDYLPADRPTLDGTFWVDTDGKPYMVFCGEWLHNQNGTIEKVELTSDLSASVGEPSLLFRASDSPWSREQRNGKESFNRVTDGPWLFRTGTGRLGMIWTSWVLSDYTMGVAYSESGTLDGPWIHEPEPITPPNFGHGMIFCDFEGRTILSAHSHSVVNGRYIRRPAFWLIDITGDKLIIKERL